ncbi:hypothetical protein I553_9264 [Mycobacterium xenopi 4042]|uniref:Uncharacterized protein n=1 Tax=Mycobacterium xenopi 4042 TaxID=1299334 RepID=X8E8R5_MYCXE|nr:hypothetical protein I553_9264 [Mycobacterium xenopi 4042]
MGNQTRPASCPPRRSGPPSPSTAGPGIPPAASTHPGMSGIRSHRPPAATRRRQHQPLPSPSVPPSTNSAAPRKPAKTSAGVAHPPVPRHTDGAHEQDQPANKPTTTSANSMTNKTAVVVTRRDGQQGVAEQRQVRRRVIGAYMLQI